MRRLLPALVLLACSEQGQQALRDAQGALDARALDGALLDSRVQDGPGREGAVVADAAAVRQPLVPAWVRTWGSAWPDKPLIKEQAWDVVIIDDTLLVTGTLFSTADDQDLFVRRYDLDGTLLWDETWDNGAQEAGFVLAESTVSGRLFLGGYTKVGTTNKALLQQWDLSGTLHETTTWGEIPLGHHEIDGIAVVDDALYVSHWDATWTMATVQATVKKLDLEGNVLWSRSIGDPDKVTTADGHIYADQRGVWLTGRLNADSQIVGGDLYLAHYDSRGNASPLQTFGGDRYDDGLSLSSDGTQIYIAGYSNSYGNMLEALLLSYQMDGTLAWHQIVGGPGDEFSRGLAIDAQHIYMAMQTSSWGAGGNDTMLLRFDKQTGALQQERIWGDSGDDEAAAALAQDATHLYLAGKTSSLGLGGFDALLLKVTK